MTFWEIEPEELDDVLKTKTAKGPQIKEKDSIFVGYTVDAKDFRIIRQAYLKIRLLNARARHVVCAYNLPGAETFHMQDYADDDENGAGRVLLQFLLQNQYQS